MQSSGAAAASVLNDVALQLDRLVGGDANALAELRPTLHRIVAGREFTGAVKTLVVQALLLLDDPRIPEGVNGTGAGAPLVAKIRKLLESAIAAHASGVATPAIQQASQELSPDALLSPDADRSLVDEFVMESREQLEIAEAALLDLDGDPEDMAALDTLFRALHTVKGTSAFLGVEHATELAHHSESLLVPIRDGEATCNGELSNLLFRSIDMLDAILVALESAVDGAVAMLPDGFRPLLADLRDGPSHEATDRNGEQTHIRARKSRRAESSLRIRTADLDRLVSVVRELVLTHHMLSRDASLKMPGNADLGRKISHAERLAFDLEDVTNELRTVSFARTAQKLVRLARDTAYQTGKSIELTTSGEDVLIERAMVNALGDPLMHMIRNAIDHGIEPADERTKRGKTPAGQIHVGAQRVGAQLVIELRDDGRGLDPAKLMRIAVERGVLSPSVTLSDRDAFALIMRPGFSTAQIVTDLSGRGVGMDVVRDAVETLGGTIDIASRLGEGTTFTIRLPFRSQPSRGTQQIWGPNDSPRTIGLIA